ncbi:NfeD family protein [Shewanella intestini]|uniref:NfeD family protein n=1 Tax=Shewanella intestini TaxID=2017544 RepID=A0ABS5I160_9GAMM|nr:MULTISPECIES: NfeD family protein [Shewanella]MBR9727563.1 NfeD family protein [Shewanella intestini]MRG35287.1 NfeD family protein [Shewanella sp. XMDDZSB0408]
MEFSNPMVIWFTIGAILMIAEIIVPGGIVILLGAACIIVAGALGLGVVEGVTQSMTLWFISSMVLLLSFRHVTQRLIGGDAHVDNTDEELDLYNQVATVNADIGPGDKTGRIRCLGSDWVALGDGSIIKTGTQVRIICRENIGFVVEPLPTSIAQ